MKEHKKKSKIWILISINVLLLVIFLGIYTGGFVFKKVSNLIYKEINKEDLSVNEEIYNNVSDTLTKQEFNNVKKIVLFGIDTQSSNDGQEDPNFKGRTDCIIIACMNPKYKTLKLISIPRDTYAEIEGHGKNKINHAYAWGQEQLAIKTINETFNLDLTEYATIDFAGLINVVNKLGGIELNITSEEKDFINRNSYLAYEISNTTKVKVSGYGKVTLDGEQALTHSRNRTVGDDFVREERQRDVIEAIIAKLATKSATEISSTLDVFLQQVTTNINPSDYIGTITEILLNKDLYLGNIITAQIPSKEYAKGEYIKGIYYFVPSDIEKMKQDMLDTIYKK